MQYCQLNDDFKFKQLNRLVPSHKTSRQDLNNISSTAPVQHDDTVELNDFNQVATL